MNIEMEIRFFLDEASKDVTVKWFEDHDHIPEIRNINTALAQAHSSERLKLSTGLLKLWTSAQQANLAQRVFGALHKRFGGKYQSFYLDNERKNFYYGNSCVLWEVHGHPGTVVKYRDAILKDFKLRESLGIGGLRIYS